jgi:hypothetical protein
MTPRETAVNKLREKLREYGKCPFCEKEIRIIENDVVNEDKLVYKCIPENKIILIGEKLADKILNERFLSDEMKMYYQDIIDTCHGDGIELIAEPPYWRVYSRDAVERQDSIDKDYGEDK